MFQIATKMFIPNIGVLQQNHYMIEHLFTRNGDKVVPEYLVYNNNHLLSRTKLHTETSIDVDSILQSSLVKHKNIKTCSPLWLPKLNSKAEFVNSGVIKAITSSLILEQEFLLNILKKHHEEQYTAYGNQYWITWQFMTYQDAMKLKDLNNQSFLTIQEQYPTIVAVPYFQSKPLFLMNWLIIDNDIVIEENTHINPVDWLIMNDIDSPNYFYGKKQLGNYVYIQDDCSNYLLINDDEYKNSSLLKTDVDTFLLYLLNNIPV